MKKIGLISDTHIPKRAKSLPDVIRNIFNDVSIILHAGDITQYDVISELETIAPVYAVCGNMDLYSGMDLPQKRIIEFEGLRIGLTHGMGSKHDIKQRILNLFEDDKVDIIVFGHTHISEIDKFNDITLINPGSACDRMFSSKNTVGIIEIEEGQIEKINFFEIKKIFLDM